MTADVTAPAAPIRRVLVANRGEIARRVIRGAHDAGCEAVAVYAGDDAASPHVGEADAAVLLQGATIGETYLNPVALVRAAEAAGADALHPGYGFLSEDAALAEACGRAGVVWVGPPVEAMRVMGHKARAKEVVAAAGVPVLPGAAVPAGTGAGDLSAAGASVGYPVLVKASAGGGGRGIRLVLDEGELAGAVAAARREAAAAFGSDEVFLERYLAAPRHVEVQVLGDTHGTVVHLFDRECSVQRRHQKLVEEAPATLVPDEIRHRLWDAAVAAAQAVDYVGAGTVEFLVEGGGFFFLEMNTRLQVEHGVTELVTGLDLVGLQLAVATGRPLPFSQAEVTVRGHAVEARLAAERPRQEYRPTPGTVTHVRWPMGPGLRTDRAIEPGSVVSPAYDSLVAKLMAHGEDRTVAVGRLCRAVETLELDGLETNRQLLGAILHEEAFRSGTADVHWLDAHAALREARLPDEVRRRHGAAVAFALTRQRASASIVPLAVPGWRNVGRSLHVDQLTDDTGTLGVRLDARGESAFARDDPDGPWQAVGTVVVVAGDDDSVVDLVDEAGLRRRYRVRQSAQGAEVNGPEGQSSFARRTDDESGARRGVAGECRAPLPGAVTKVLAAPGDTVVEGDGLVVLEAMKMEHTLRADGAGTVVQVACAPGQQVDVDDLLVTVEPA